MGFNLIPLHNKKEPHAFHYLSQRASFWVAIFSLIAFVSGNMVGQHGWYVFWKSVMGGHDDSLIVYTGTVTPIEYVPDYSRWAAYGGNPQEHTFRQVPKEFLIPLPVYNPEEQRKGYSEAESGDVYSMGHMGSYLSGAEDSGSHTGVDIRTPIGTSIRSIANGIVDQVRDDIGGFGQLIVVRHPNVPDPVRPTQTTTLYSAYAHLSAILVDEGDIVQKGENIALSGKTGFATGPHLHFQIDRDEAPWHPYWPFSVEEAEREGLSFLQAVDTGLFQARGKINTVHPLLYVQSNYEAPSQIIVQADDEQEEEVVEPEPEPKLSRIERIRQNRAERIRLRLARRNSSDRIVANIPVQEEEPPEEVVSTEITAISDEQIDVVVTPTPVIVQPPEPFSNRTRVWNVDIQHDGSFAGRGWEKLRISLLDKDGYLIRDSADVRDLYLRTAYGNAEFRPSTLSGLDFVNGVAEMYMLPRGKRTVVVEVVPLGIMSKPMAYEK
jgi:murein DD-endopeptidase MepM/ murein hydrolase activator NlpD